MQMQTSSYKNWLTDLAERYHAALLQSPETLSYLAGRGLDLDAVTGARLGLVTDPDPSHDKFAGRLAIPYMTPSGTVHMRFRCLEAHECKDSSHGKYEGVAGEEGRLFNVMALHHSSDVIGVCEGELDALVATAAGLPSVGVAGAQSWKPHYFRLFDDYERVILLGDGDAAGHGFVAKLAQPMSNSVRRPMPEGFDVSSYVVESGASAFLEYALE